MIPGFLGAGTPTLGARWVHAWDTPTVWRCIVGQGCLTLAANFGAAGVAGPGRHHRDMIPTFLRASTPTLGAGWVRAFGAPTVCFSFVRQARLTLAAHFAAACFTCPSWHRSDLIPRFVRAIAATARAGGVVTLCAKAIWSGFRRQRSLTLTADFVGAHWTHPKRHIFGVVGALLWPDPLSTNRTRRVCTFFTPGAWRCSLGQRLCTLDTRLGCAFGLRFATATQTGARFGRVLGQVGHTHGFIALEAKALFRRAGDFDGVGAFLAACPPHFLGLPPSADFFWVKVCEASGVQFLPDVAFRAGRVFVCLTLATISRPLSRTNGTEGTDLS